MVIVIITIVVYIAVYCVQTFVSGVNPVDVQTAFGATCIIVGAVTLYLNIEPKAVALYNARRVIYESESKRFIFDDISPVSNDRERLHNGTKPEKIKVCQEHLMVWCRMLAEVSNSELRSSHDSKDENRSGNKKSSGNKQSSHIAMKHAVRSVFGSRVSHGPVNRWSRAGTSEN